MVLWIEIYELRRLEYHYERDSRVYWNRILSPELLEETIHYCDTDQIICEEVDYHLENEDLEFAYIRASGPRVRCNLRAIFAKWLHFLCSDQLTTTPSQRTTCIHASPCHEKANQTNACDIPDPERIVHPDFSRPHISDYFRDVFGGFALAQGWGQRFFGCASNCGITLLRLSSGRKFCVGARVSSRLGFVWIGQC